MEIDTDAAQRLPATLLESLNELVRRIDQLSQDIDQIERRLAQQLRESPACQSIAQTPGIGLLTAIAVVSSMGNAQAFKDAREFSAWVGLVPRQSGTDGRVLQIGISKSGDAYLRTLRCMLQDLLCSKATEHPHGGRCKHCSNAVSTT